MLSRNEEKRKLIEYVARENNLTASCAQKFLQKNILSTLVLLNELEQEGVLVVKDVNKQGSKIYGLLNVQDFYTQH